MSQSDTDLAHIIGTNDPTVLNFINNIYKQSNGLSDFAKQIQALDVGLDENDLEKVFKILESPKFSPTANLAGIEVAVAKVLKDKVSIDDKVVTKFVLNILNKSTSLENFRLELQKLDAGLESDIVEDIYVLKSGKTGRERNLEKTQGGTGLVLPNQKVTWNDINDNSDLFNGEQKITDIDEAPILNKIYKGKVRNITKFGLFVSIFGTRERHCEGLVHISQLSETISNYSIEQLVYVKIIKIQGNGKILLSVKEVDQKTGTNLISSRYNSNVTSKSFEAHRGRTREISNNTKIKKRRLTSPERWELRQLIASGAASIDDYPELAESDVAPSNTIAEDEKDTEAGAISAQYENADATADIELNTNSKPSFLKDQTATETNDKVELQKQKKVPRGSMNRAALFGSKMISTHREEKLQKKKDLEKKFHKSKALNRMSETWNSQKSGWRNENRSTKDINQELALTAWERKRMREKVSYGKVDTKPIDEVRQSLPVFGMRSKLVDAVKNNQFLIIVGETGSGKTTQITQYLREEGFAKRGIIGCTQPRRVAAVSVATRVASEVGCKLGDDVGYAVRFDDRTSIKTDIKYMTDGILQIEALNDPNLSKYSVIMLDEAHERTVATDILFALLKDAASKRSDLKVIVTSATLDSEKFSEYFNNCPIIKVPGKTFPVEVMYSSSPQMDYIESALEAVMNIHINEDKGDILVFLTGQEEIDSCCEILYSRVKELGDAIDELVILPVYSALPSEIQSKIFEPTPEGSRKVVFATNIAETSITIDGIRYVIDPGFSKMNTYNPRIGMEQLVVKPISQAQANQRKGRAGRTGPGKCYRLYTESAFYNEMLPNSIPEIQRQNLSHTILMLKAMGINDLLNFDFMDPPPKALLVQALQELFHLQALDDDGILTKLGKRMSQFPMEPSLSRTLVASVVNNCTDEITTIISMLSVQNIFYRPKDKQQAADQKKVKFYHPYGDHLTLLNVYTKWKDSSYSEQFCELNFLHHRHLKRARDVKNQIYMIFERLNLPISSCHGDPDLIRKTLVAGFFMNASKRDSQLGYKTLAGNIVVAIHPSSSLYGKEYDYVLYHNLVMTNREYMSQVTSIEPEWLVQFAPHFYKTIDFDSKSRKRAKIAPLHNKFAKDQNSWRLSSLRQSREKALGVKR